MDFTQEVLYFKNLLKTVTTFCQSFSNEPVDVTDLSDQQQQPASALDIAAQQQADMILDSGLGNSNNGAGMSGKGDLELGVESSNGEGEGVQKKEEEEGRNNVSDGVRGKEEGDEEDVLFVPESEWSSAFTVTKRDCELMQLPEIEFLNVLQKEAWARLGQKFSVYI
jgi:hypothetical protein